ncbi:MAG: ATPase, T2SS/T4P/T4SS family [Gaiellaceae bacterium]
MEAAEIPTPLPAPDERAPTRLLLGAVLVRDGALTIHQLEQALAEKEQTSKRLGEIVVQRGWVTFAALAHALAEQHGLDYLDLSQAEVDPVAADLLPEKFARRYQALPVGFLEENLLLVAVADPTDVVTSDDLRLALGLNVQLAVVAADELEERIATVYRAPVEVEEVEEEIPAGAELEDILEGGESGPPAIKVVNSVLSRAIEEGASDVHFEPQAKKLFVRARIDGVMRELTEIPRSLQPAVTSRLKIMAGLDIAEKRAPQDGRVPIRFGGQPMDLRMAVLPTTHGEQVVLRILHLAADDTRALTELGMSPDAEETFLRAIRQPYGAVITVGPTGSGKTTTLYAALDLLNESGRVLMTIEDPVEYQIPGVNQIEVNPRSGLTFARGLRTILRSDPDVLLVGEIRDEETARIAIQAAMTGRLVLTTLHTHNAASSIARLKDMGIEPGLLASSLNCIVAQRLARRLCTHCREAYYPKAEELAELNVEQLAGELQLYRAVGCARCAGTGYRGRVALYEVMPIQGRIRRLIDGSTDEIFAAAVEQGMTTMRQDGLRLCLEGVSSVEEIRRVTGDRLA